MSENQSERRSMSEIKLEWFGERKITLENGTVTICQLIAGSDGTEINADTAQKIVRAFNTQPELVAALEKIIGTFERCGHLRYPIDMARQALAKAKGEV